MRQFGHVNSSQSHVPEVYQHTEQRAGNPSDKVNVTTYVFQTSRGGTTAPRVKATPQFRSMTPQPTATYYTEEKVPVGRKISYKPVDLDGGSSYMLSYAPAPQPVAINGYPTEFQTRSHHLPPQYHYINDPDSIDNSHIHSVQQTKALFERRSWRDQTRQKMPAGNTSPRQYHRHTTRLTSSSAPPTPNGRYEIRVKPVEHQRFGNYEVVRAVANSGAPVTLDISPTQGQRNGFGAPRGQSTKFVSSIHNSTRTQHVRKTSSTQPGFHRVVPRDDPGFVVYTSQFDGNAGNEAPAWYGSLKQSRDPERSNAGPTSPPQPVQVYGSLHRHLRSRSSGRPQIKPSDDVFSPVEQNHVQKIEMPNYKTIVGQPFVSAQALKQSVTNAAAIKQHSGGLLKPSSGPTTHRPMPHYGHAPRTNPQRTSSFSNINNAMTYNQPAYY